MGRAMQIEKAEMPTDKTLKPRSQIRQFVFRPVVCSVCAFLGVFGGLLSLFLGLFCVVVHAVVPADHIFNRAGTILLIAGIPMMLAGSVFLDEIPRTK